MKKLSELEGVSLGIVSKFQPCTAYAVRRMLKESPSSHWRASAGSLYPLLARLERSGLISSQPDEQDGRGRKLLHITPKGLNALREWIQAGAEQDMVSAVSDPIRFRSFFLDTLDTGQQKRFLDEMIVQMQGQLEITEDRVEKYPEAEDFFGHLGSLGAVYVTRARLDWLVFMRQRLTVKSS